MVGLVTYNGTVAIDQTLTPNYNLIRTSLAGYTNLFRAGATNIGGGIAEGQKLLCSEHRSSFRGSRHDRSH